MGCDKQAAMKEYLGERENISIFSLNSYCINEIFLQIEVSCASSPVLDDLLRSPWIEIDFSNVYAHMLRLKVHEKKLFWKNFLYQIRENERLESVKLVYEPISYCPEHLDRFDDLINCLKNKNKLRELSVKLAGYGLESVPLISSLETLILDARMEANVLVQLCSLNPNLRRLVLVNNELYGRLSDIVPHCNQLEYLSFAMKLGVDAAEYKALARLPRLSELILLGEHEAGSLVRLFQALKERKVERIWIPESHVSNEEAFALASITSLISLKCCLRNDSIYADLPLTGCLTDICILRHPSQNDQESSSEKEEDRMKVTFGTRTPSNKMPDAYYQAMETEDTKLMSQAWDQDFSHAFRFRYEGRYSARTLLDNMNLSSESSMCFIEKIVLYQNDPIPSEDIPVIASIPTLTTIRCSFAQIEQMIAVKVLQLEAITETERRVDRIRTEHFEVRLVHGLEFVTLILDFFGKCKENYAKFLAPLATLRNLKRLEIKGKFTNGSLVALFKGFSSLESHTLQEVKAVLLDPEELDEVTKIGSLRILHSGFFCSKNMDKLAKLNHLEDLHLTVHPQGSLEKLFKLLARKKSLVLKSLIIEGTKLTSQEVGELAGLISLQNLQLGMPEVKSWEQSSEGKRDNLDVTYCQKCRLPPDASIHMEHQSYVQTLSSVSDKEALTARIAFITDLYRNLTPVNMPLLANLPNLERLGVYVDYSSQPAENLLRAIAQLSPKKLRKLSFVSQNFQLISTFENLQSLESVVYHTKDIHFTAQLKNLTKLEIYNPQDISLWELLKELKALLNLQCLLLDNADLEFLDLVEVTKVSWLKRLRLGLADKRFVFMLIPLKNLEVLEITSTHYAAKDESNFIVSYVLSSENLRSISLYRFYDYLKKDNVNVILNTIKLFRDPFKVPPFKLRGIWSDFKRLSQLDKYNVEYMELEGLDNSNHSAESDEDTDNEVI
ncbi:uncharacterized protein LOC108028208 isoform X2 [Drosophila biarmipes]|uniref:uncharacterized protein LOC108028208 isoform X2 n=1 Tax=Drosophila biarmipes TaxID=125945 RepID=UPI0021CC848B|nr:uncharacterized protein LOC108028208 isoform X2 [Drosophila biarmipes]